MTMRVSSSLTKLRTTKTSSADWANVFESRLRQLWHLQRRCLRQAHRTDMEHAEYFQRGFLTQSSMPFRQPRSWFSRLLISSAGRVTGEVEGVMVNRPLHRTGRLRRPSAERWR